MQIIGFQRNYSSLNLKIKREAPMVYDLMLIIAHMAEVNSGFRVKKVLSSNNKGTKIKYEAFESKEQVEEYINSLKAMVGNYNKIYKTDYKFMEE